MLSFRPLTAADLPLLHDWLNRDHAARWWHERPTPERYLPAIEGRDRPGGVAGVDLLPGEEEPTGRGLGARVLRGFARDVVRLDRQDAA